MTSLEQFKKKWCDPEAETSSIQREDLEALETELDFVFPEDYLDQLSKAGSVAPTPGLIAAICEQNDKDMDFELSDLSLMFDAADVKAATVGPDTKIGAKYVAIAKDCQGNLFCFKRFAKPNARPKTTSVYLYDLDFKDYELVNSSFDGWIKSYLAPWTKKYDWRFE